MQNDGKHTKSKYALFTDWCFIIPFSVFKTCDPRWTNQIESFVTPVAGFVHKVCATIANCSIWRGR